MKRCLAFASAILALALVVFVNTAAANDRPVKKTVDFAATLNPRLNLACGEWCTSAHDCLEPPDEQLVTQIREARHA